MDDDTRGKRIAVGKLTPRLLAQLGHYIDKAAGKQRPRKAVVRATRGAEELSALNALPPPRRGRPKFWIMAVGELSTKEIANAILAECWGCWLNSEGLLPTTLTVAKGIARRLGVHNGKEIQVGRALLNIAELAGVVREVRTFRKVPLITFTTEVENLLSDAGSIDEFLPPAEGLHPEIITAHVTTQRGRDQLTAPFEPRPGTSPWDAAQRVRSTRWRVNRGMRTVAGDWLQDQVSTYRAARHSERQTAKKFGADLAAYRTACRDVQNGYLAVRWDYRGRLNQVDSALTYTSGSDLARAVLEFDEARIVRTEAGRVALARHVLNQWDGEQARKIAHGSELQWIKDYRAEIKRIAEEGTIVTDASHPLRLVAACRAWCAAERGDAIRLPVSIDATTSMLQHMALLLRDPELARLSNLWPGPRQDFYTKVAERCGSTRKVVKAAAMPLFYGQTANGAMDALSKKLVEIEEKREAQGLPVRRVLGPEVRALATQVHTAAAEVAPTAVRLYEALRAVADHLTARGGPIQWTTPSAWQCVTDRRKDRRIRHEILLLDGAKVQYTEIVPGEQIHLDRQRNAIAANLIHSCDASLLHLAVADALPAAVNSVAVAHDCFAVHADDVPALRAALMQALKRMYADNDLLAQWWEKWETDVPLPARGTWDDRFLQGEYAFC